MMCEKCEQMCCPEAGKIMAWSCGVCGGFGMGSGGDGASSWGGYSPLQKPLVERCEVCQKWYDIRDKQNSCHFKYNQQSNKIDKVVGLLGNLKEFMISNNWGSKYENKCINDLSEILEKMNERE